MSNEKMAVPGQVLATEEEYLPGKNTIGDNGEIKSTAFGKIIFNESEKEVEIDAKSRRIVKEGDIVYGRVSLIKDSTAVLELIKAEDNHIINMTKGQIAVRNISNNFVERPDSCMKLGDIIKAKVILVNENTTDLSTKEEGFGVIVAYCTKCRKEMVFSNNRLTCFDCNQSEDRKWYLKKETFENRPNRQPFNNSNQRGRFNNINNRNFNSNDRGVNRNGNRNFN